VNTFSGLVHTARQVSEVGGTRTPPVCLQRLLEFYLREASSPQSAVEPFSAS
jgi:hypothetical protein